MIVTPVQTGTILTSLKYPSASLGPVNLAKPQDPQGLLRRTESCAASIGQNHSDIPESRNALEGQSFTTRNLNINPSLQFKPILGEGREERREIVRKFFNTALSIKIYGSKDSALSKIEKAHSDRTCRLLYDGNTAVGLLVYKKALTNNVSPNSLEIKTLVLIDSNYLGKGYDSVLLNKVEEVAAKLQAQFINVTVNSICPDSIEFFKKNGFVENHLLRMLEKEETNEVLLIKELAKSQFTAETPTAKKSQTESESRSKRKSLATSHEDEDTHAKTSKKHPYSSKEERSNVSTEQPSMLKSQHSSVDVKDPLNRSMAMDSSAGSMQKRSFYSSSSNQETDPALQLPPNYNTQNSRSSFDQRNSVSSRTQYVARRVLPHDASRPPRMMEATLKKIYVDMIKRGTKTIEGRINSGMFSNLREGQLARFFYSGRDSGEVTCEITKLNIYKSFEEMLTKEGHKPCLPDAPSLQAAITVYDRIPTFTERAKRSGVVAIHLKKISEK